MKKINNKGKLNDLKEKAAKRKTDANYRQIPNKYDIKTANENAKMLELEQYKTFTK